MRFKINLIQTQNNYSRRLSLNYQYELSAATYNILANGNEEFAEWLHENGFRKKTLVFINKTK